MIETVVDKAGCLGTEIGNGDLLELAAGGEQAAAEAGSWQGAQNRPRRRGGPLPNTLSH